MKRHHVVALFLLVFGGLFAYIQFHPWGYRRRNSDGHHLYPTRSCCIFLRKIAEPGSDQWESRWPLIIIGLMAAYAAFTGDIAWAIFLCIGVIGGGVLSTSFRIHRSLKKKYNLG